MFITINTERLHIRPLAATDNNFVFELLNTEGWIKNVGNRNINELADADAYIKKILEAEGGYCHVFEDLISKKPIGMLTFIARKENDFPDIGFATLPQFERRGFTYEAANTFFEKIKESKKYSSIIGIALPSNIASLNLLKKLGLQEDKLFKEEGSDVELMMMKITL
jgi:[ribosomal protein S5]-alanine N-acetyltransferase